MIILCFAIAEESFQEVVYLCQDRIVSPFELLTSLSRISNWLERQQVAKVENNKKVNFEPELETFSQF